MHAIWTAAGFARPFKCQPRSLILSPMARTSTRGRFDANATTLAGGSPRTYSSVISFLMARAMVWAQVTIDLQEAV